MGKNWLTCVSAACLSQGKDKKNQKLEKEKKKWFKKQKSRESIECPMEEDNQSIDPSTSSFVTISRPSPPPLPDFAPQPSLPPPSPPPHRPLHNIKHKPLNTRYGDFTETKTRQALALASAVAAEAAVVAAHAAAEVVRLTNTTSTNEKIGISKEDVAAIKIQNAYKCYKAREALRVLRGIARLKTLLQGNYVKRQTNTMLSSMQTFTRLQTQIQERRIRLSQDNKARHRLILQKGHQKEHSQNQSSVMAGNFDLSNKSKEQIEARFVHRKEASVKRERALAYAYSHQQTWRNTSKFPQQTLMDQNTQQWGWSWLERWMASRPWDQQSNDDLSSFNRENSIKTSPARSKTLKSASQSSIHWPINNDSKSKKSEWSNRRHSFGGGSSKSVKDENVGKSLTRKSSFGNKHTIDFKVGVEVPKNLSNKQPMTSKASVGTRGNLGSTKAIKNSKASLGTQGKLINKEAVKSKVSVGKTSNLVNKEAVKSKVNVGTTSSLANKEAANSKVNVGSTSNLIGKEEVNSKINVRKSNLVVKSKVNVGTKSNLAKKECVSSEVDVRTISNLALQKTKVVSEKKKSPQMALPKKRLSSTNSLEKSKKLSDTEQDINLMAI
ncbi:unnamed protein product [Cochlearia groenlandica]